jgi:hypothetical protein
MSSLRGSVRVSAVAGEAKSGMVSGGKAVHGCVSSSCAGFRDFIMRGNVVDLAVAIVVGAAFSDLIKCVDVEGRGGMSRVYEGAGRETPRVTKKPPRVHVSLTSTGDS